MSTNTRNQRKATASGTPPRAAGQRAKAGIVSPDRRPLLGGHRRAHRGLGGGAKVALVLAGAVAVLGAIFYSNAADRTSGGDYPFQVGDPGLGQPAPMIQLPSTDGTTFDLGAQRGQTVLLYFQEGVMCQPCWTQITDIEANWAAFEGLGVDKMVSITNDPLDVLEQKVEDEGISTPVLADPDLAVSRRYEANQYGMMGTTRAGHSFVLVDENGVVKWRADYGGAPNYTMYLPVERLVADMRDGLAGQAG
ncbi:MAG: peroxiredoxin family protein [Chloroflexota bacterium]|nr:peroxiredoxin family protein [Chloroflexota bacterium]